MYDVGEPCASTVPESVAVVAVIELALPVATIGAPPGPVVNDMTAPMLVPVAFVWFAPTHPIPEPEPDDISSLAAVAGASV